MQARLETSREPQRPSPRYFGTRAGLENECQGQTANWVPFQPPQYLFTVGLEEKPPRDRSGRHPPYRSPTAHDSALA